MAGLGQYAIKVMRVSAIDLYVYYFRAHRPINLWQETANPTALLVWELDTFGSRGVLPKLYDSLDEAKVTAKRLQKFLEKKESVGTEVFVRAVKW